MINLNRNELFQALLNACQRHTDALLYVEGGNPYRLSLNGSHVTIFVGNVHFASRSDPDEFRIQCPGDLPSSLSAREAKGDTVCILGYYAGLDVYSAWEPRVFLQRNPMTQRFSIYTRLSKIELASKTGFSKYVDTDGQVVLMFRSEFLGLYIENASFVHLATEKALASIAEAFGSTKIGSNLSRRVTVAKKRIRVTHTQYARSPHFRAAVLSAYRQQCAMCGLQLDLVEAAHIVPHAHAEGSDSVGNGLALCALHHNSFDKGLTFVDKDFLVQINEDRVEYLDRLNLTHGLGRFTRTLRRVLALPDDAADYPLTDNLVLGNRLRGIGIH